MKKERSPSGKDSYNTAHRSRDWHAHRRLDLAMQARSEARRAKRRADAEAAMARS